MAPACHSRALRGPLRIVLLLLLGARPSFGERGHLVVEPDEPSLATEQGPDKGKSVSEIVSAATEQTLAPLREARAGLQKKLQELDAKMAKLRDEQDALQEEAQRQDERVRTLEENKQRYDELLDKARDGLKALERNYTSNTEEAGRILRCLSGGCGRPAEGGAEHDGETDVMNEQKELEAGLLGPAADVSAEQKASPDVSAEQKETAAQLDAQLKADAAAEEKQGGIIEAVQDFIEDHFTGDEDEKTIGEPVHDDGTPLAPGENATNTTSATNVTEAAGEPPISKADVRKATEAIEEANDTEEGSSTSASPLEAKATEESTVSAGSEEGGSTSLAPVEADETDETYELDPDCQDAFKKLPTSVRQHFVGFAKGKGDCKDRALVEPPEEGSSTSASPLEANAIEESIVSAGSEEGSSTSASPLEAKAMEESTVSAGSEEGGSTSTAPVTEESPYDHADDTHELDPDCQDAFTKLPTAIRQHFVGFAKGKGDCKNRAMVPQSAPESEDGGSTSEAPPEAKATEESTTSAGSKESGSTSTAPVEAIETEETSKLVKEIPNQPKPREAPVEVQHHDATESTVSAGSEEGSEEEDEEEANATNQIAISTGFEGDSSKPAAPARARATEKRTTPAVAEDFSSETEEEGNPRGPPADQQRSRHVPGLGGLEGRGVSPHRPDGEKRTASGFAPPSATDAQEDACTEVKYSWKSVRPSATVCLPEDAPMTALLAAVCSEQLGPAGYDIAKCSAEPYVRCQGKNVNGKWYSVDMKEAPQATVSAELQNDFANAHFTCENKVKLERET